MGDMSRQSSSVKMPFMNGVIEFARAWLAHDAEPMLPPSLTEIRSSAAPEPTAAGFDYRRQSAVDAEAQARVAYRRR